MRASHTLPGAFAAATAVVSLALPATSMAMASHEPHVGRHTAYSPVGPKALHLAPPVGVFHYPAPPHFLRHEMLRPAMHHAVRLAAKLKR